VRPLRQAVGSGIRFGPQVDPVHPFIDGDPVDSEPMQVGQNEGEPVIQLAKRVPALDELGRPAPGSQIVAARRAEEPFGHKRRAGCACRGIGRYDLEFAVLEIESTKPGLDLRRCPKQPAMVDRAGGQPAPDRRLVGRNAGYVIRPKAVGGYLGAPCENDSYRTDPGAGSSPPAPRFRLTCSLSTPR
jgi:hypothetical protein